VPPAAFIFRSFYLATGRPLIIINCNNPVLLNLDWQFISGKMLMNPTGSKRNRSSSGSEQAVIERLAGMAQGVSQQLAADHLDRMDRAYRERYTEKEIAGHLSALSTLGPSRGCRLLCLSQGEGLWELTVSAFDHQGLFSIIAGTLASQGLSIEKGEVWTYSDAPERKDARGKEGAEKLRYQYDFRLRKYLPKGRISKSGAQERSLFQHKKIVDVFTVKALSGPPDWEKLERQLDQLVKLLLKDKGEEARKKVGRRVVDYLSRTEWEPPGQLMPVRVNVNNELSDRYTVMDIEAEDTPAFLYLFTNALARRGVDIHNISIGTQKGMVRDRFYITDSQGARISGSRRINELKFIVVLVKQFSHLLVRSPDPIMALANFERLVERIYADQETGADKGWKMLDLTEQPVMEALARLFGTSNFLWEDFLRLQYENLLPVFADLESLENYKDKAEMWSECEMELLGAKSFEDAAERLNRFKDREMFRIDMRHILDKIQGFTEFSRELTDLMEVVVEEAYRIGDSHLRERYGNPLLEDGSPCKFAVFALGKAGGRELGYASDIELLFVHSGNGSTNGDSVVSTGVYFEKLVQMIIKIIRSKRQGIFEIDLRFRPFGNQGPLSNTLKQMEEYYSQGGQAWDFERQCLVRLRIVAGDSELGSRMISLRDGFVYSAGKLDFNELYRLRQRQQKEFVKPDTWNAKFSEGGLVEIEYHVQHLQIIHGVDDPSVRCTGTRDALKALGKGGYITREEMQSLLDAHDFYRILINALRILRGNARDLVVPERNSEEFLFLARRMGYPMGSESRLAENLVHHRSAVVRLVDWQSKIKQSMNS
jgi:glutamate-ammonia-ligase adenylyltransferase